LEECRPCPVSARFTLAFALQLRKSMEKPLRVAEEENASIHKEDASIHRENSSVHKENASLHKENASINKENASIHRKMLVYIGKGQYTQGKC
jgi:hypothetical protein